MHKVNINESGKPPETGRLSRREVLVRGAAAATTVAAGGSLLSACGSGGGASGSGSKDTVTFLTPIDPGLTEIKEKLLPQFTEETGVKVKLLESDWGSILQKQLRDAQNNTGAYDLEIVNDWWVPILASQGLAHDLEELGVRPDDDMFDSIVAQSYFPRDELPAPPSAKGKRRAYVSQCIIADVTALVYRRDLIDTPPRSWDELLAAARTKAQPDKRLYGYSFPGSEANGDPAWWLALLHAYGGRLFDDDWNPTINSPEAVAALEMQLELEKTASPGVAQFGYDQFSQALNNGQTVSAIAYTGWIKDVFNPAKSKVADKMACAAVPNGSASGAFLATFSTVIPTSARNPEGAGKLLAWLTSQRIQRKYGGYGGISMRPSVLADPKLVARYPYFTGMHDSLQIARGLPATELSNGLYTIIQQQLNKALSEQGSRGAKTYLDAMADQFRKALDKGGYYS